MLLMTPVLFLPKLKSTFIIFLILSLVALACLPAICHGRNTVETFFHNTDYELNVYRINGKVPGKTIFIIGGIQGDEPGGFLSADLYADMKLVRGNLIVVPRANSYSIILNRRQVNEDMNRKFSGSSRKNYEAQVVSILKQLISESDCLLNLHDGSGFYSDTWQNEMKNPKRYGQSIIMDCENYSDPDRGSTIALGELARDAISKINGHIDNPDHLFHINNHRTRASDSLHPEQRKSATYYALYECGIPAFGIESSKSLPLETRIYHHNLAINAFMEMFNIIPEVPGIGLSTPQMKYAVVKINNSSPVVVANGETLHIYPNDTVKIIHIEGNYARGFSADIEGYGSVNDVNKPFSLTGSTRVLIRKDHLLCGSFNIVLSEKPPPGHFVTVNPRVVFFKIRINGKEGYYPNGSHVDIVKGDLLELVDAETSPGSLAGVICNFKGFVGDSSVNTGEDRGYIINTATDLWERYSLYKKGRVYQIIVSRDGKDIIGRLFFDIKPPLFEYMLLSFNGIDKKWVSNGEQVKLKLSDSIKIVDIKSNVAPGGLTTVIRGKDASIPIRVGENIAGTNIAALLGENPAGCGIRVSRGKIPLALISVNVVDYKPAGLLTGDRQNAED